ncbi:restriction endonuclease subunit S [Thiomicrospira sp. XS5]|uniref:restriction endonuclease subunit S n=1 Tax=Thiomicrospira sp. XS5 TaxID=1775636 RepID=UPI000A687B10|nr:restriction endonuclease subunit S [Thiomicrospira sp. XS5]
MAETKSVPDVRFKGFPNVWTQKFIHEVANRYDNLRVPVSASNRISGSTPYYGANGVQDYVSGYTHDGEFVLLAEDGANDLNNYPVVYVNGKVWVNNHAHVLQGMEEKLDNLFLKSVFSSVNFEPFLVGGGRAKLNAEVMMNINLNIPQEITEQKAIGTFFKNLDSQITHKQRKLDKLMTLKKAMLEKLFPKEGADKPEIRFKGFSGTWELKSLGELIDIRSAARVHKEQWTLEGVPFFRTSDVIATHKEQENTKAYISSTVYEELIAKIGKVKKNDLLITGGGSIGVPFLIKNNNPLYFKDADLLWLKNDDKFDGYFLYTFFFSSTFRKHIKNISHIGTIAHYTIEQAKATPIKTCSKQEQKAIGSYFKQLDNLITLQKTELTKLKQIKSACLEKMFV